MRTSPRWRPPNLVGVLLFLVISVSAAPNADPARGRRPASAPPLTAGVVHALNARLLTLQSAAGDPRAIADSLRLAAQQGTEEDAAAALILLRSLTEPEAYSALRAELADAPSTIARLNDLRTSLKSPGSARELKESLDALFVGARRERIETLVPGAFANVSASTSRKVPHLPDTPEKPLPLIPGLVDAQEIVGDPTVSRNYYELLKARFKNRDFDEILFIDNPDARGPRLSPADYDKMLSTLRRFLEQHPEEAARLRDSPPLRSFRVTTVGDVESVPDETERSWSSIGEKLAGIRARVDAIPAPNGAPIDRGRRSHRAWAVRELTKRFTRSRDPEILQDIADSLLVLDLTPETTARLSRLPSSAQRLALDEIQRNAARAGKDLDVPGRALELLAASPRSAAPSVFRKGTVFAPMSRLDAVFKGIGTGECVRAACNRYFDAFFDDAMHLRILKDGKEIGFVAVYKTKDKRGLKLWFLETIQTPLLADGASAGKIMRGLIRHLQQEALHDGSMLSLPAHTFNSYNFKEVVGELEAIPETKSGESRNTSFRTPQRVEKIGNFNSTDLSEFDRMVTRGAGYSPTVLTNGYEFNDGEAVVVQPLIDQPDWYVQGAHDLLSGKSPRLDPALKLDPLRRAQLLKDLVHGAPRKRHLYDLRRRLLADGRAEDARRLLPAIYDAIPEKLRDASFDSQFEYVAHRIQRVRQSSAFAQSLKDELILKARTWSEYRDILRLEDKDGESFAPFLLSTFDRFTSEATPAELLTLYQEEIRYMPNDQSDLELTRKVGAGLRTADQFLALVKMTRGEGVRGSFGDDKLRDLYIAENWERFRPENEEKRLAFADAILDRVRERADLQIRQRLLARAGDFAEVLRILNLSKTDYSSKQSHFLLAKMAADAMIEIASRGDARTLSEPRMDPKPCFSRLGDYFTDGDRRRLAKTIISRANDEHDLARLLDSGRITLWDVIIESDEPGTPPAAVRRAEPLIQARVLNEPLLVLRGSDLENALSSEGAEAAPHARQLIEQAHRSPFWDVLKWRSLIRNDRLLRLEDARSLVKYLRIVRRLPQERQAQIEVKLTAGASLMLTDVLPEHEALIRLLEDWSGEFESRGEHAAARGLRKRFRIVRLKSEAPSWIDRLKRRFARS